MPSNPLPHPERERSEQSKDAQRCSTEFTLRSGGTAGRGLVEALIIIMTGHELALDQRVKRVAAPAAVAKRLIEMDRRALGVAQVEIEHEQPEFARQLLDFADDAAADAVAARPRRDKSARDGAGHRLRLVVARRPRQLRRTADDAIETADDEAALRYEQHALPVILQELARRRL